MWVQASNSVVRHEPSIEPGEQMPLARRAVVPRQHNTRRSGRSGNAVSPRLADKRANGK